MGKVIKKQSENMTVNELKELLEKTIQTGGGSAIIYLNYPNDVKGFDSLHLALWDRDIHNTRHKNGHLYLYTKETARGK